MKGVGKREAHFDPHSFGQEWSHPRTYVRTVDAWPYDRDVFEDGVMVPSIYETAIRHRVSPEFIGSRNCVPMTFTAEAQGQ